MKKCCFLFFSLSLIAVSAFSQTVRITGDVSHVLTREGIRRAVVTLWDAGGKTILATDTTRYRMIREERDGNVSTYPDKTRGAVFSLSADSGTVFLLQVEADGFEAWRKAVALDPADRRKRIDAGSIYLMPQAREYSLGEATVTATKIKMFYNGDTLVYNADAFNVAQHESLRKLVEQLPGAEMKDGVISVNGRRVDNLLLSGKDFFNGNIQAALDNLPAYIVSKIKVYDKAGELSELTGRDMHDQSYVMDVRLKREYIGTWMAKVAADGATEELWGGQGFLMRMDDRQMLNVSADINNFNERRQMSDMGDTSDRMPSGRETNKTARLDYYIEPSATWRFRANASVRRTDTEMTSWTNTETFLTPSNMMTRSARRSDDADTHADASLALRMRKAGNWQHELSYGFRYDRTRAWRDAISLAYFMPGKDAWAGLSVDSIYRLETSAPDNALLYSLLEPQLQRRRSFSHNPEWNSAFTLGGDVLNIKAYMEHHTADTRRFDNYNLTYYEKDETDRRRRFGLDDDYGLKAGAGLEYTRRYEDAGRHEGLFTPYLRFDHDYGTLSRPEYRLERVGEWSDRLAWGAGSLGLLPEGDWRSLCLDLQNSYDSRSRGEKATAGVRFSHKAFSPRGTYLLVEGDGNVLYDRQELYYTREVRDYRVSRDGLFFAPALSVKWAFNKSDGRKWVPEFSAGYRGQSQMPGLVNLLPIRDAADPLNIFTGNENLKNLFTHRVEGRYAVRHAKSGQAFNVQAVYRRVHNDLSTFSVYDAGSGVRTYRPVNTARTHGVKTTAGYTLPLGPKRTFYLSASFDADYLQTAHLSYMRDGLSVPGLLRRCSLTPGLSVRGTVRGNFRLSARWDTSFHAVEQSAFTSDYRETVLYVYLDWTLPFGLQLGTNVKTRIFAGNSDRTLDETVTRWDISLRKYFLDDRLGLCLSVNDVLAQASTFRSSVDAMARTETYTDIIPRYIMLRVSYRMEWSSKRKK